MTAGAETRLRVLFVHGLESSPQSSKALFLAEHFVARTPAMDTSSFEACVTLQAREIAEFRPDVVVGSSFGGAVVVALLARGAHRGPTLLLAPAQRHYPVEERLPEGVAVQIVHGTRDEVVDIAGSRALARSGTPGLVQLLEVDDEHRLQSLVTSGRLAELVRSVFAAKDAGHS
ncbi:MAG TPA: YqiA/YcfP family alpha/beta fold hydrolase [Polyangiaceae bacterium]|nr:YqiA/YcfP family alpha/beta fold hydrolase [Polyangiaceae bacterium]